MPSEISKKLTNISKKMRVELLPIVIPAKNYWEYEYKDLLALVVNVKNYIENAGFLLNDIIFVESEYGHADRGNPVVIIRFNHYYVLDFFNGGGQVHIEISQYDDNLSHNRIAMRNCQLQYVSVGDKFELRLIKY